jgi:hypothetical protein
MCNSNPKRKLWIDVDVGVDDAQARLSSSWPPPLAQKHAWLLCLAALSAAFMVEAQLVNPHHYGHARKVIGCI